MTVHWWNSERLARDLVDDKVSELDSCRYMMIGAVLYLQATYFAAWFGGYRDWSLGFELLVVAVISLVGVHECYKANGATTGRAFLARFSALAVPVGLKLAPASLLLGQALYYAFPYVVGPSTFRDPELVYRFAGFAMSITLAFVYYWRIAHHLARVRATELHRANAP